MVEGGAVLSPQPVITVFPLWLFNPKFWTAPVVFPGRLAGLEDTDAVPQGEVSEILTACAKSCAAVFGDAKPDQGAKVSADP